MQFFRRLGIGLAASFFSLLLFLFALFVTVYAVLGTPDSLKKALRGSGIYGVFVDRTLTEKQRQGEIAVPATEEAQAALRQATLSALSPTFVQQTAERSLDQAYDWLHGRTERLGLTINAHDAKQRFASGIATYVQQRVARLPSCTGPVPVPATLDEVMALTCRPAGVAPELLAGAARQEALKHQFFDQFVLTASNLKDDQGRPLSEKLEAVPQAHRYFILSLYILPALLILLGAAIIFGSPTRRSGMKRVAYMLLWTGVVSVVWAFVAAWGLNRLGASLSESGEAAALQSNVLRLVNSLAGDFRIWWAGIGAGYIALSIGLLISVRLLGKHTTHEVKRLNKSLGYTDVPSAGTTFDPDKKPPESQSVQPKPKPTADSDAPKNKNSAN